jgi:hypothetical protein
VNNRPTVATDPSGKDYIDLQMMLAGAALGQTKLPEIKDREAERKFKALEEKIIEKVFHGDRKAYEAKMKELGLQKTPSSEFGGDPPSSMLGPPKEIGDPVRKFAPPPELGLPPKGKLSPLPERTYSPSVGPSVSEEEMEKRMKDTEWDRRFIAEWWEWANDLHPDHSGRPRPINVPGRYPPPFRLPAGK